MPSTSNTFRDRFRNVVGRLIRNRQSAASNPSAPVPFHTPVRTKPGLDFSMTGLVYSAMMLFMGLAAVNSQANLLFGVFGLMIGILLVSAFLSRIVLRKVTVRRSLPHHGEVGRPVSVEYEFTNEKRFWPTLSLCIAELDGADAFTKQPSSYLLHVAPKTTTSIPAEFLPRRRGLHELDRYQISTSFPFGFVKRARTLRQRDRMLIYPAIGTVDSRILAMCRSAENSGATVRPRVGGMDEFYGVKEFREGDNPRMIYWRRSARAETLVMREMTQVAPPRLLLVVDTFVRNGTPAEHAEVEKAIAMAASVATRALDDGMSVGLYAWTGEWTGINPERGKRHRDDLLSVIARLPLNREHETSELLERSKTFARTGTTQMLLTPREMGRVLGDRGRGAVVVVSVVREGGSFRFEPSVDFATCTPHEEGGPDGAKSRKGSSSKSVLREAVLEDDVGNPKS